MIFVIILLVIIVIILLFGQDGFWDLVAGLLKIGGVLFLIALVLLILLIIAN